MYGCDGSGTTLRILIRIHPPIKFKALKYKGAYQLTNLEVNGYGEE
jgi:hypothetical protein